MMKKRAPVMTYEEARDYVQLRELDVAIKEFIFHYKQSAALPKDRQTVILFPGGCGSQLKRSPEEYDPRVRPDPSEYEYVWLNCWTLIGAALLLKMKQVDGSYVEDDNHIIIASGSVQFLGYTPYDDFIEWCRPRGIDVFLYGYDWRRPFEDTTSFFVTKFLPYFQRRVVKACNADPLEDVSLVGHCMGGMLVNWILRRYHKDIPGLNKAVTVATPFYGYAGQIGRWFAGEPLLNYLGRRAMVQVISSFPALYAVNFLDADTYLANEPALEDDASERRYPLLGYPSTDAATAENADPYNPQTKPGPLVRYPRKKKTGFDPIELARGQVVSMFLAEPITDKTLSAKFFNIRGVLPGNSTVGSTTWAWIDPAFKPWRDKPPITMGPDVPGDDTQPAWTARLVRQQQSEQTDNIITVESDDAEHVFIMTSAKVLEKLAGVLGVPPTVKAEKGKKKTGRPRIASSRKALEFVRALQAHFKKRQHAPFKVTGAELQSYLKASWRSLALLKPIARRILIDLVKPLPNRNPDRRQSKKSRSGTPSSGKSAVVVKTAGGKTSRRAASNRNIAKDRRLPRRTRGKLVKKT
jgi:hypothetical protein